MSGLTERDVQSEPGHDGQNDPPPGFPNPMEPDVRSPTVVIGRQQTVARWRPNRLQCDGSARTTPTRSPTSMATGETMQSRVKAVDVDPPGRRDNPRPRALTGAIHDYCFQPGEKALNWREGCFLTTGIWSPARRTASHSRWPKPAITLALFLGPIKPSPFRSQPHGDTQNVYQGFRLHRHYRR